MVNNALKGINRASLIRWTAIYLLVYALLHACGSLVFGLLILAIFYLIMVPVFGVAAFGLVRRRSWAWRGAVIALSVSVLLSW